MASALILKDLISELGVTVHAFERKIGASNGAIRKAIENETEISFDTVEKILAAFPQVKKKWLVRGHGPMLNSENFEEDNIEYQSKGDQIRLRKAFGNPTKEEDDNLIAVPIGAQAGGAKYYEDPLYANQLEVYRLPGMPYRGAKYRLFQVDGDSMEFMNERNRPDGLVDRMWIVTQKVDPIEHRDEQSGDINREWQIDNYYVYVIVEARRIRVKRLYQYPDNKTGFVVISDNPDWEQEWLPADQIQELWLFKRKLDWDASPPKMHEIKVKPPQQ